METPGKLPNSYIYFDLTRIEIVNFFKIARHIHTTKCQNTIYFVLGEGFMQGLAKRKETAKERIRSKVKEPMFLFVSPSLSIIHLLNPSSNL